MIRKTATLIEQEMLVDLTLHKVPVSLITEFAEKIVQPHYKGSMNAAVQDLLTKALVDQDFVLSHITHIRSAGK